MPFALEGELEFSPRARGCSYAAIRKMYSWIVFPACAGMFLKVKSGGGLVVGFPRVRGDVPRVSQMVKAQKLFSPRARGCSETHL